jgi:hypothetical protein
LNSFQAAQTRPTAAAVMLIRSTTRS